MAGVTDAHPAGSLALDRLFCYGSLMTGFSRWPLLGPAVLEGTARVRGSLYDFGEYPGIVLDDGGWVVGELYRVPDLGVRLPRLDAAEGYDPANPARSLYLRGPVTTHVAPATTRDAWLYVYNPAVGGAPGRAARIDEGDWRAHVAARGAVPR